jgi:hypothetical protein
MYRFSFFCLFILLFGRVRDKQDHPGAWDVVLENFMTIHATYAQPETVSAGLSQQPGNFRAPQSDIL